MTSYERRVGGRAAAVGAVTALFLLGLSAPAFAATPEGGHTGDGTHPVRASDARAGAEGGRCTRAFLMPEGCHRPKTELIGRGSR